MRISGPSRAVALTVVATAVLVVATAVLVLVARAPSAMPPGARAARPPAAVIAPAARADLSVVRAVSSLAILRDWDRARARAWAAGEPRALRPLYTPRSDARRQDRAMLRSWTDRGLRVRGMQMQVLGVVLRSRTARRLVLVVTDRLVGAVAVGPGADRALPRDNPSTRRLVFVRVAGRWRLAAAYDTGSGSSPASPAASTASTSGSANS